MFRVVVVERSWRSLTEMDAAAEAIKNASRRYGVLADGGLRLDPEPGDAEGGRFAVSMATSPRSGDEVLAVRSGANVLVHPEAAARLTGTTLDVREAERKTKFRLLRRG